MEKASNCNPWLLTVNNKTNNNYFFISWTSISMRSQSLHFPYCLRLTANIHKQMIGLCCTYSGYLAAISTQSIELNSNVYCWNYSQLNVLSIFTYRAFWTIQHMIALYKITIVKAWPRPIDKNPLIYSGRKKNSFQASIKWWSKWLTDFCLFIFEPAYGHSTLVIGQATTWREYVRIDAGMTAL